MPSIAKVKIVPVAIAFVSDRYLKECTETTLQVIIAIDHKNIVNSGRICQGKINKLK